MFLRLLLSCYTRQSTMLLELHIDRYEQHFAASTLSIVDSKMFRVPQKWGKKILMDCDPKPS